MLNTINCIQRVKKFCLFFLVNAWLLGCAAAGLRGYGVALLQGCALAVRYAFRVRLAEHELLVVLNQRRPSRQAHQLVQHTGVWHRPPQVWAHWGVPT